MTNMKALILLMCLFTITAVAAPLMVTQQVIEDDCDTSTYVPNCDCE